MSFKALATPLALAAGLAFSTSAFAQTEIGTITVSDEDLPLVEAYCNDLALSDATGDSGTQPDAEPSPTAEVTTDVQLDSLTLQDCEDAGLVGEDVNAY